MRERVAEYLRSLDLASSRAALSSEAVLERASQASDFLHHPYWALLSRMLAGTIHAETEEMLSGDAHLAVNRASVAICRKILSAPFADVEQGRAVQEAMERLRERQNVITFRASEAGRPAVSAKTGG